MQQVDRNGAASTMYLNDCSGAALHEFLDVPIALLAEVVRQCLQPTCKILLRRENFHCTGMACLSGSQAPNRR